MKPSRRTVLAVLLVATAATTLGGCGWIQTLVGMKNGYFLRTQDVIALPAEPVALHVRLESGSFFRDVVGRRVEYRLGEQLIGTAVTDDDGLAEITYTPSRPGDYLFAITAPDGNEAKKSAPAGDLLVACRRSDAPIIVADLDGTVVAPGYKEVVRGDPPAIAGSAEALREFAKNNLILYLTARPGFFGPRTRDWLAEHGFPRGPVVFSKVKELNNGSRRYKSDVLAGLRGRFSGFLAGVGDGFGDVLAYNDNGMAAFLLVNIKDPNSPRDIRKYARKLDELPDNIQVVSTWVEIRQAMHDGMRFSKSQAQKDLLQLADEKEAARKQ